MRRKLETGNSKLETGNGGRGGMSERCRWASDEDGTWFSGCGEAFVFESQGPRENGFRFCPYCGGTVELGAEVETGNSKLETGNWRRRAGMEGRMEIWRRVPGDYYSPSIHVTSGGGIGLNCGGHVIFAPVEAWHECGEKLLCVNERLPSWRWRLAMRLLRTPNAPADGREGKE